MLTTELESAPARTTAAALNRCIEVCTDAERGYAAAAAGVRHNTLKAIFRLYEAQSANFVRCLRHEVDALGLAHENTGTTRRTLDRAWAATRPPLEGRKDEMIVDECMRREMAALGVYDHLLRHADTFLGRTRVLLTRQRAATAVSLQETRNLLAVPPSPR